MPHVQIRTNKPEGVEVLVDGVDIGPHVLHEGFSITTDHVGFRVNLAIFADTLDADLPGCALGVVRDDRKAI